MSRANSAYAPPTRKALATELPDAAGQHEPSPVFVHALLAWLLCQVGIIVTLPWLSEAVQSPVRAAVMATYWLTFRRTFRLNASEDALLGATVVGFELFLAWWASMPLSVSWYFVVPLWLATYVNPALKHRLYSSCLRQLYAVLRRAVYATTTTARLQNPHFSWANRYLATLCEALRRRCAYKLCALNQVKTPL
jgi:hypothetical protein